MQRKSFQQQARKLLGRLGGRSAGSGPAEMPPFHCPLCPSQRLRQTHEGWTCAGCGRVYPVLFDLPVLVAGVEMGEAEPPADAVLAQMCAAYQLPADPESIDFFSRVMSREYRFPDVALSAENNYLVQRLQVANAERASRGAEAAAGDSGESLRLVRHYVEAELPRGVEISHNIRIRNEGRAALAKASPGGWSVHARWMGAAEDGSGGPPARIPVTLAPGAEVTIPLRLRTPDQPGSYVLELALGRERPEKPLAAGEIKVKIGRFTFGRGSDFAPVRKPALPDYDEDHREAIRMLEQAVTEHRSRLGLELGGGSSPMTCNMPCRIVNTDIDVQMMQIARFVYAKRGYSNLDFLCCDSHKLPFPSYSFDFAAVFASLHHYADPEEALRSAARVVKPEGFVAVMCEPAGHYSEEPDAEMQKALDDGINEQRFSLREYQRMFEAAGLRVVRSQLNADSLKAILRRSR